ncbi:hypothetical protein B0J17DRAFT_422413 [Rhizoctonia solani]|nr:hypothetical protein B0J17DRAFT_422413 [Rhizoctonia solani]
MSIPTPVPPPLIPDPKLDPTTLSSQLPQAQVENLRYKIIQIMEGINGLLITLNMPGMQLAAWPDLMTKYNVLLSKTHTLASSLSTPPTRKGMIGFRQIVPTPFAVNGPPDPNASTGQTNPTTSTAPNPATVPNPSATANPTAPGAPNPEGPTGLDPQLDAMLEALLDGRRSLSVTKTDVANVARLHLPGGNAGGVGGAGLGIGGAGAGVGVGLGGETVPPDVMLARLEEVRDAHDARCARGVEAVRQLKDKYDWKSRLLFDDSESESSISVASHHSSEERNSVVDDEEMVEVAPPDEEIVPIEEEGETPTQPREFVPVTDDSDSDDEEEVQVGLNVGEGAGGGCVYSAASEYYVPEWSSAATAAATTTTSATRGSVTRDFVR